MYQIRKALSFETPFIWRSAQQNLTKPPSTWSTIHFENGETRIFLWTTHAGSAGFEPGKHAWLSGSLQTAKATFLTLLILTWLHTSRLCLTSLLCWCLFTIQNSELTSVWQYFWCEGVSIYLFFMYFDSSWLWCLQNKSKDSAYKRNIYKYNISSAAYNHILVTGRVWLFVNKKTVDVPPTAA